jgi:tetratricopeptide (TPR) repeat protein
MSGIFISHTHTDQPIADALRKLVEDLFEKRVTVNYSSRKELEGGISPGEDWFRWIVNQVREADQALILLTPASIQKPWVVWEAGAVAGASFAQSPDDVRVLPLVFGLKGNEVPTPFARTQLISGTEDADLQKLVDVLFKRFATGFTPVQMKTFGARQDAAIRTYLGQIAAILMRLPMVVTEASIQEWLGRLEALGGERRFSEAEVLENWMDVAFGRDAGDKQRPLDVRIHRRLGELYARGGRAADAARQFELARQLAPRDIFLLRRLGKAWLDNGDLKNAGLVLADIEDLDKTAFVRNSESAALKARWHRENNDLLGARDVLESAYKSNPTYYLGDLLGQALVGLGQIAKAKEIYAQVSRTLRDLGEANVWTAATALSAAIVTEDAAGEKEAIENLRRLQPSRGELDSIERGARQLLTGLSRSSELLGELRGMEWRGTSERPHRAGPLGRPYGVVRDGGQVEK